MDNINFEIINYLNDKKSFLQYAKKTVDVCDKAIINNQNTNEKMTERFVYQIWLEEIKRKEQEVNLQTKENMKMYFGETSKTALLTIKEFLEKNKITFTSEIWKSCANKIQEEKRKNVIDLCVSASCALTCFSLLLFIYPLPFSNYQNLDIIDALFFRPFIHGVFVTANLILVVGGVLNTISICVILGHLMQLKKISRTADLPELAEQIKILLDRNKNNSNLCTQFDQINNIKKRKI